MHDPRARLQCAEEVDGMVRRVAEEQRDGLVAAVAGAQEGAGSDLHFFFELGVADRPVAEFNRGTRAILARRARQQVRQRETLDRVVPADALRIKLFAGMSHVAFGKDMMPEKSCGAPARSAPMSDGQAAFEGAAS